MNFEVDLHGMTVEEALAETDRIINRAFVEGYDGVKIITGRGKIFGEVLKVVRAHDLVVEVLNDGFFGFLMIGRVEVRL